MLAVPKRYRAADIKRILYASDFRNYAEEVKKVVDFGLPLKAKIEILHFMWPAENTLDEKTMGALKKKYKYGLKIHVKKNDLVNTLVQNLQKQIRIMKPSVVVMFTNQERTFFEKIFLSSKSEQLSFQLKVPLLVFNKG